MAVIECDQHVIIFDTSRMNRALKEAVRTPPPPSVTDLAENNLTTMLGVEQKHFCATVCQDAGCQAKNLGADAVGQHLAQIVLGNLILKILSEPKLPNAYDGTSSPTAFPQ